MDYKQVAKSILDNVGGADNVKDATHCFTRLRLVLRDPAKASKDAVSKLEGVIQVVEAGGQFQVVLGGKVNKIYDEFLPMVNVKGGVVDADGKPIEEVKGDKGSVWNYILQTISNIFTPIVPAIAASGLIKGLLSAAVKLEWLAADNSTYVILNAASNAIFYFMPIFLAYTTAKALKCNRVIAMMLGAFLCMPAIGSMMTAVNPETGELLKNTIFGLPVVKMAFKIGESVKFFEYTESVIPIILAVIVLKWLEKGLVKIIPEMLQIILVPGLSLIIMVPVILTVVGPVGAYIGYGMQWVYSQVMGFSPLVGGALVGALWGVFVIFGAHRALLPVGLNDVSVSAAAHKCGAGHNTLMCYAGAANFSQAGAALGVMLKTRSKKLRQVAGAATISAFLVGITEPAIYGCNLRKKRPMICAIIAGAVGGAIMGIGGASNHGFANNGILTIPTYSCADNTSGQFVAFLIGIAVAFFGAAVLTYIVGFEDDKDEELRVDA
jgi:PTS system beta-glucosides-specific IIC component